MQSQSAKKKYGYTIVEMIVVIAILSIIMPTVFSIIYIIISQQVRIFRVSETKRQGDKIAHLVKDIVLREATGIYKKNGTERCASQAAVPESTSDGTDFVFSKTKLGMSPEFHIMIVNGILKFVDSSTGLSQSTHSNTVIVSNLVLQCIRKNSISNPIVGISFLVTFVDKSLTPQEGIVEFPYVMKIKLRR